MNRPTALLVFVVAASAFAPAIAAPDRAAEQSFQQGNQAYERGDWDGALQSYVALARQGWGGPSLFYNLGNTYFRRGERGQAVLWYERALRLSPRDADVRYNLDLARSHIKADVPSIARRVASTFTTQELGWTALVLSALFFGVLGCYWLGWVRAETWPVVLLWCSGILGFGAYAWFTAAALLESEPAAIVKVPPGEVRNGPGSDYAVGFTIPEGSRVLILNRRPDWIQIGAVAEGLKGWMPAGEVEEITPGSS